MTAGTGRISEHVPNAIAADRKVWVPPTLTRAGHVADLVQALKASGGPDCGGTRHQVNANDTCGL